MRRVDETRWFGSGWIDRVGSGEIRSVPLVFQGKHSVGSQRLGSDILYSTKSSISQLECILIFIIIYYTW